ncbi:Integrator complex subunit 4 [Ordospora colligata]|uniref:Uncharacterized protein n=1 Tax=Ordospora colligata OC4 TaxID=1354746 RepID=A0A0B2UJ20_9MICR|nr:uncharacterized protein M896_100360 [Ordospora colligata OC4]KHN69052.1 hypothetical protein M896_100360 [Ordospora colligata OC4]TBU14333.1 hypothetical protein CWI40_100370 [Ordospora colligata]TBU14398.1 hypothetical protein CWI41_100370 [Ordospora colligata]
MLPGLQIFDEHEFIECKVLSEMVNDIANGNVKSLERYFSDDCNDECNDHHVVVYLENVIDKLCFNVDEIRKLLVHKSSKVRKIALFMHQRWFTEDDVMMMQNDPCHIVREAYLLQGRAVSVRSLVKQAKDENVGVRFAALKRLVEFANIEEHKMKILKVICSSMRDREHYLREFASKAIGEFRWIDEQTMKQMMTKQAEEGSEDVSGALVYGIEDEYSDVRRNTVRAVYKLTTHGTVSQAFEFLVDSLNDDDEDLRVVCTEYLVMLSKKYELMVDEEIVVQISEGLRERSDRIKLNILSLLSNLRYENTIIYDILMLRMKDGIKPNEVHHVMKKIASRNSRVFFADLTKFYVRTPIARVECSLEDPYYITRLVVLRELCKSGYKIDLSRDISDHFLFVEMMESKLPKTVYENYQFCKDILCQFITEKELNMHADAGIQSNSKQKRKLRTERMYNQLFKDMLRQGKKAWLIFYIYKGMSELMNGNGCRILRRIPYLFGLSEFNISMASDINAMKRYIQSLDIGSIQASRYILSVPSVVEVNDKMPIRFSIGVLTENACTEARLKIWVEGRPCMYFGVVESLDICIMDNVNRIYCCIVKPDMEDDIQLSRTKSIIIDRKKPKADLIPGINY